MNRYVAFLRAINVGGHVVKMDTLRAEFEALKFENVATFIASGNVIFDGKGAAAGLEKKIEKRLADSLGYDVATFLRTPAELAAIVEWEASVRAQPEGISSYVVLLKGGLSRSAETQLTSVSNGIDQFRIEGREVYWLVRGKSLDSQFSGARLEKMVGAPVTVRNITTMRRLAAKYPA